MDLQSRMLLKHEVEEFLYHEAELLDSKRYQAWLDLLTEDIHYWIPIRRTTTAKEIDKEFTQPGGVAFFDENLSSLKMRVARMEAGRAWAEDPPSRTRRLITNIKITGSEGDNIAVQSNFLLYRTRLASEEDSWIGRREEIVRRVDGGFKLAQRHIYLEQTVILAQNMSSLF